MIAQNLARLRSRFHLTQEEVAEQLGISRQTVAKWESGASLPDLESCIALARLYDVTVDDLISYSETEASGLEIPPKGKYFFGAATVGERGQIVIPKKARELFGIRPGDHLLILGDENRGLALVHQRHLLNFAGMAAHPLQEGKEEKR